MDPRFHFVFMFSLAWVVLTLAMYWLASGKPFFGLRLNIFRGKMFIWGVVIGSVAAGYSFYVDIIFIGFRLTEAEKQFWEASHSFLNLLASILGIGVGGNLIASDILESKELRHSSCTVRAHHHFNDLEWDGEPAEPVAPAGTVGGSDGIGGGGDDDGGAAPPTDATPQPPRPVKIEVKLADGKGG